MLDLAALQDQLKAFSTYQEEVYAMRQAALEELIRLFKALGQEQDQVTEKLPAMVRKDPLRA